MTSEELFEESTKDMSVARVVKIMKDAKKRLRQGRPMTALQMFLLNKQRNVQEEAIKANREANDVLMEETKRSIGTELYMRMQKSKLNDVLTEEGIRIVSAIAAEIVMEVVGE